MIPSAMLLANRLLRTGELADPNPFEDYLRNRAEAAEESRRRIEAIQGPQANLHDVLFARAEG